jgi:4-amino-4-deoxy-L-arabinose transferase-like glycosyltransferase
VDASTGNAELRVRAFLAGIVTAGILMRIPGLLHDGLWRDEAYVYVDVIAPAFGTFIQRMIETEYHPPLYFLMSYLWSRLAGTSELSFEAFPFLFGVLTIPAVYRLGRTAGSPTIGLLAAGMYAVSPLAILESSDYLYPIMGLLCTVLAALVMTGRREALTAPRFAGIAVITMLTTYTHYAALFYVPMLVAWALTSPRGVRHGAALSGALLLGALPFLFWLPTFLSQPDPYLLKPPGNPRSPLFEPPPNALAKLRFFLWTIARSMPLWPEKLALVLSAVLAAALVRVVAWRKVNSDAIAMGSIYAVALALVSAAGRFNVRYVAPFEGLFCVFLAWLVAAWFQRIILEHLPEWRRFGIAATATICAFILTEDLIFVAHTARLPKSGIRTFVASAPLDPATLYMMAPDYIAATFAFYAQGERAAYTAFPQTDHPEVYRYGDASLYGPNAVRDALAELQRKARDYRYLDLVVDDDTNVQRVSQGVLHRSPVRQLLDSIKARYPLVARAHYPGRLESITVYRFRADHSTLHRRH